LTFLPVDIEALAALRRLVAQFGGSPLPEPSGWAACDDCSQVGAVFARGKVMVCARDWCRRDSVASAIRDDL